MKRKLLCIILLLCVLQVHAQKQSYSFLGTLAIKDSKAYSYKLDFTDSNGIVHGYSITDVKGRDETKTAIAGTVNTSKKEFRFRETRLIYTKSPADKDSFCYVHTRLKLTERRKTHILRGSFRGYHRNGKTECARGTITMLASEDLLKQLMKIVDTLDTAKKAELKEKIKEMQTAAEKPAPAVPDVVYLMPGSSYDLLCKTGNAHVELWDHEKVDGDIISIQLNGKTVLDRYSLVSQPRELNIPLSGKGHTDTITLVANGEGAEPPNTVRMKISCGETNYTVQASSTMSEGVQIRLKNE